MGPSSTGACPNGGIQVTDGSDDVGNICNDTNGGTGATGPQGPQGPAGGLAGYTIVSSYTYGIDAFTEVTGYAQCPSGEVPTGGGFASTGGVNVNGEGPANEINSRFLSNAWGVDLYANSVVDEDFIVYAVCVDS